MSKTRQVRITDEQLDLIEWVEDDANYLELKRLVEDKIKVCLENQDYWRSIKEKTGNSNELILYAIDELDEVKNKYDDMLKFRRILLGAHQKRKRGRPVGS
ncbi:hypothetical protein AB1I68_00290 [Paenibacillus pabuli]|uniref:hypothetical protein n=1 Tax=Paenibacillus pabuli TaxID=1472 RepID=UPI00345A5A38